MAKHDPTPTPRRAVLLFADAPYTTDEERVVFKYMDRRGPLTIKSGTIFTEYVVVVLLHNPETLKQASGAMRCRREATELRILKHVLNTALEHAQLSEKSSTPCLGQRALVLTYGPDVHMRPTTTAVELLDSLRLLGCELIERVEIYRRFSCQTVQYLTSDEPERMLSEALLGNTALRTYDDVRREAMETIYGEWSLWPMEAHTWLLDEDPDDAYATNRDPVARLVLLPASHAVTSVAAQTATDGRGWLFGGNIIASHAISVRWPCAWVTGRHLTPNVTQGLCHIYADISIPGQQLECLRRQRGLLLAGKPLAALVGIYASTPCSREAAELLPRHRQLCEGVAAQAHVLNGCRVPIVGGFVKTLSTDYWLACVRHPLVYACTLAIAPHNATVTTRFGSGQLVVCLGAFDPAPRADAPPYDYADSSLALNRAIQALEIMADTIGSPAISSHTRSCNADLSVCGHLLALLGPSGGATLYMSALPEVVRRGLVQRHRNRCMWVTERFLSVQSPAIFIVLKNSTTLTRTGVVERPISVLIKSAQLARCPVAVLGVTTRRGSGLRIVDDIDAPVDPTDARVAEGLRAALVVRVGESGDGWHIDEDTDNDNEETYGDNIPQAIHDHITVNPWLDSSTMSAAATQDDINGTSTDMELDDTIDWELFPLPSVVSQLLSHPTVSSKEFFVHHVDRCGNGLVAQQPGVGPFDLPLSDYALVMESALWPRVMDNETSAQDEAATISCGESWWRATTQSNFLSRATAPASTVLNFEGHVMTIGEQAYKSILNPTAGAKLAITEALTNMMFGPRAPLCDVTVTAAVTWDIGTTGALKTLEATLFGCKEFARELGVGFVVTSAARSTRAPVSHNDEVRSPGLHSVVVSARCRVRNDQRVTPVLRCTGGALVHLSVTGDNWLTGSTFAHTLTVTAGTVNEPDAATVHALYDAIQDLVSSGAIVAGHDVSDGGVLACAMEMAIAGNRGLTIQLPSHVNPVATLVSEAPGAVVEASDSGLDLIRRVCVTHGLYARPLGIVGEFGDDRMVTISHGGRVLFKQTVSSVRSTWRSFAREQYEHFRRELEGGELYVDDYGNGEIYIQPHVRAQLVARYVQPPAILDARFQVAVIYPPGDGDGSCGETPLLSAFSNAGFVTYRVCLTEIMHESALDAFIGIAISGDTGYKDSVTGARCLAFYCAQAPTLKNALWRFLLRPRTFSLGCGELGFEVLKSLRAVGEPHAKLGTPEGIPALDVGLDLEMNASAMYESRWLSVHIPENSVSIMLRPLAGSVLPCWVQGTHLGLHYNRDLIEYDLRNAGAVACTFHGRSADESQYARQYPRNPTVNSTTAGICSTDGRHLATLFNPALTFHMWQWQHVPESCEDLITSPWSIPFFHMHLWCGAVG
uniref:Tegument protein n=1 Tax=Otarine gammaherpesvirus 4 TaxID=2801541 RepID=A0A889IWC5_9GAMA|nr:Tegument protein [Otarine gammaherpesvirus 4]